MPCFVNTGFPTTTGTSNSRAVLQNRSLWPQGHTIKIAFLNGARGNHQVFEQAVRGFLYNGNQLRTSLNYQIVPSTQNSDIRVVWNNDNISMSTIGKDAWNIPQSQPTLHLGNNNLDNAYHEFWHVLGGLHEHGNPSWNVRWDKNYLYDLGRKINWTPQLIDDNICRRYNPRNVTFTAFDQNAIGGYPITAAMNLDRIDIRRALVPSATDLATITQLYPPQLGRSTTTSTPTTGTTTTTTTGGTMMMEMADKPQKSGGTGIAILIAAGLILFR